MGHDDYRRDSGDSISTRLTYLLIGGGIGAVIALLFAPKSGQESEATLLMLHVKALINRARRHSNLANGQVSIMSLLASVPVNSTRRQPPKLPIFTHRLRKRLAR